MRELVSSVESFNSDGYTHTAVVWKEGDTMFIGTTLDSEFDINTIKGNKLNDEDVYPPVNSQMRKCTDIADFYIKAPELAYYDINPDLTKTLMISEIECLEEISKSGTHPYVVQYHGCQIRDGLIVGICLEKCLYTLDDAIDMGLVIDVDAFIHKVKLGLEFIHNAGYVHDDIHSGNIMVMENGDPKLKAIGSAQYIST
ncbi:hypothetical protein IWW36_000500 [Coemansia brasiliensis]|uniref:Protein kinase domain-containing protein n=1 Tax=Coemansia brasiliensis TaxID=2650707 RepID=A0A9W8III6_9FUNG|nr:hypothetical protein IWW36_000500 [Coemansia brasiliensis]